MQGKHKFDMLFEICQCSGGGEGIRLIACIDGFKTVKVISPTATCASWIQWCMQVYACVGMVN